MVPRLPFVREQIMHPNITAQLWRKKKLPSILAQQSKGDEERKSIADKSICWPVFGNCITRLLTPSQFSPFALGLGSNNRSSDPRQKRNSWALTNNLLGWQISAYLKTVLDSDELRRVHILVQTQLEAVACTGPISSQGIPCPASACIHVAAEWTMSWPLRIGLVQW